MGQIARKILCQNSQSCPAARIPFAGAQRYSVELVTSAPDRLIRGESGITLQAHRSYRDLRGRIDTLLVAGGIGAIHFCDGAALAWLRTAAAKARRLASVCTGAFVLAEAGFIAWTKSDDPLGLTPRSWRADFPISRWTLIRSGFKTATSTRRLELLLGWIWR